MNCTCFSLDETAVLWLSSTLYYKTRAIILDYYSPLRCLWTVLKFVCWGLKGYNRAFGEREASGIWSLKIMLVLNQSESKLIHNMDARSAFFPGKALPSMNWLLLQQ